NFWQQYIGKKLSIKDLLSHLGKLEELETELASSRGKDKHWFTYYCVPFFTSGSIETIEPFILTRSDRKFYDEIKQITNLELEKYKSIGKLHEVLKSISDEAILFVLAGHELVNEGTVLDYLRERKSIVQYMTGQDLKVQGLDPGS